MSPHAARPLRTTLALRFAAAALVPILGTTVLVLWHLAGATVRSVEERNNLIANAVSGQFEGLLREPLAALGNVRGALLATDPGAPEATRFLEAAVRSSTVLESVYLIGPGGRVEQVGLSPAEAGHAADYVGIDVGHQPFYREALATGRPVWSDTFLSILSGRMSVALCVPVDARVLMGILTIESLMEFVGRLPAGPGVTATVIDRGGAFIVHPDAEVAARQVRVGHLPLVAAGLRGERTTGRIATGGSEAIGSVTQVAGTGWVVLVTQDAATAFRGVRTTALAFGAAILATILATGLLAIVLAGRVARPLGQLVDRAREVARGGYDFSPPPGGPREVAELAGSFQEMARAVASRERSLRESEEKHRLLVENAGDAIFVSLGEGIPFANAPTAEILGLDPDTLRGARWTDLVHPADRPAVVRTQRAGPAGDAEAGDAPLRVVRPDGSERRALLHAVPIRWEGGAATLNFLRDVTELRRLEEQALQAQKMEAVGMLAGGIAHDFNNLLQAIQGYAELALMPGRGAERNRAALEEVTRAAQRGAELTGQLLAFSRKGEARRRPLDVNAEIRGVSRLLERALTRAVRVVLDLAPELPAVAADPVQLQQVLMNLAVNARDAMPGGGVLRIATARATLGAERPPPEGLAPGEYVEIAVSDSGSGIEERVRERIFEPFFTTKEPGKGTGLGLAMVYGIVRSHEGAIACESLPGAGTTFRLHLPALPVRPPPPAEPPAGEQPRGSGRVLVVDDERSVRAAAAEILEAQGYEVLAAADGEEALALYRAHGGVDAVLLDLVMPGIGGRATLAALLEEDPEARVVVASGYSAEGPGREVLAEGARAFLHKPFGSHELLSAVREAIEAAAREPGRRG